MQKVLKILLVVILGIVGTCVLLWALGATSSNVQELFARGEACAIILIVVLFVSIGAAIFKAIRGKS